MRAADRDPAGGEIPVELIHRQPLDDFPQRAGVSRTNKLYFKKKQPDKQVCSRRLLDTRLLCYTHLSGFYIGGVYRLLFHGRWTDESDI